jgi:RNA polymerase primary sigma factor
MRNRNEQDGLRAYLREITKYPLLTRKEELELAKRIEKGDEQARDKMIQSNLRFVVSVAKQFQGESCSLHDLISYGNEGLLEAVDRFDYLRGLRFISYAVWWIRQTIIRALQENSGSVTFPVNVSHNLSRAKKDLARLCKQGISSEEAIGKIASEMGRTPEYLKELLPRYESSISLDSPIIFGDGEALRVETIPSGYPDFAEESIKKDLKSELSHALNRRLSRREREILEYRFGLKNGRARGLKEIGDMYGITKERIRQIENEALRKLRPNSQRLASYLE